VNGLLPVLLTMQVIAAGLKIAQSAARVYCSAAQNWWRAKQQRVQKLYLIIGGAYRQISKNNSAICLQTFPNLIPTLR